MEMVRATILKRRIDDIFWPEIVLAMTQIKNLWPTQVLKNSISIIEMQNQVPPDLHYLCIFDSNIYIFFHKEEQNLKLAK